MEFSNNTKGAFYMALSMAGFASNDALIKAISHEVPVGEIMFVRGVMTTVIIFLITWKLGALRPLRVMMRGTVITRVFFEVAAGMVFLAALGDIPLANITSIIQSLPLAVTLGAALFLKEPTGWRRWLAISIGFCGVLLVMRPGPEGFTHASMLAVVCVFLAAGRDLTTRRVPPHIPSLMLTTLTVACITLTGGGLLLINNDWQPLTPHILLHLGLGSVLSLLGYHFVIAAMRTGEISFIAPFRYVGLLVAIAWGILFFSERLDGLTLVGIAVIVGSGLYTFHREARRKTVLAAGVTPEVNP